MKAKKDFRPLIDLRNIIEQIPGPVYWCDVDGVILGCNQVQAESFGLKQEKEAINQKIYDFYSIEQAQFLREINKRVIETNTTVTLEESYRQPSGNEIVMLSKKVPLHDAEGNTIGILGSAVDISSQREAQQEQTWLLEDIIGKMPGHVWWKDKNCLFMGCNDNQAQTAGLSSRNEIRGKSAYDVIIQAQPEAERKKQADAIDKTDKQIIKSGKGITVEEPLTLPNGKTATYLSCKEPLRDRQGNIIGLVGIAFDISSEKEKVIAEQKAKISAVLAAGIAHELRTPLAAINVLSGQLENIMQSLVSGYQAATQNNLITGHLKEKQVTVALNAGHRLKRIAHSANIFINMMLMKVNLEKPKSGQLIKLSIVDSVQEALNAYPFRESEVQMVKWDFNQNQVRGFHFMGDQTLFSHIIFNLLKNALYHIKTVQKGVIEIWVEADKKHNFLHFKDTGQGIPPDVLPSVFDAFYTRTAHGTGVGLALCKMIMMEFGGDIACESKELEYTHFTLKFPKLKNEGGRQ